MPSTSAAVGHVSASSTDGFTAGDAAQALLPWLKQEAKERQRISPGRPPEKGSPNSDYLIDQPPMSGHPGKSAEHAAKLTGVGKSLVYAAQHLSRAAETDAKAAELVQQVKHLVQIRTK